MATIQTFRALRFTPKAGDIHRLVCPPYDIVSEEQRKEYTHENPYNIIRLELPREGVDPYITAGEILNEWLENEIVVKDERPALYIYDEEFQVNDEILRVKGITCRVRLEEFEKGVILPHEETLSKAKADRFELMKATGCNFSSIYSLYFDESGQVGNIIDDLSRGRPNMRITDEDGVTHRLWIIHDEPETDKICELMADKKLYIADGHHRYETAINYRNYLREKGARLSENHPANYIMMHLVNIENPGLVVLPTHRIVRGLESFHPQRLIEGCGRYFEIADCTPGEISTRLEALMSENRKAFALYYNKSAKILILKDNAVMRELLPEKSEAYRDLDVSILHTLVLERILGIDKENMANQKNLVYTRDAAEAMRAVDGREADCAFIINPTKVAQIAAVAGAGEKMPQKSTYFYPKLTTGLTMNSLRMD